MDWTMVHNAGDMVGRLQTLFYLFSLRYGLDAQSAGELLRKEPGDNLLCYRVLAELRSEIAAPTADLTMGRTGADEEIRKYLTAALATCDAAKTNPSM